MSSQTTRVWLILPPLGLHCQPSSWLQQLVGWAIWGLPGSDS